MNNVYFLQPADDINWFVSKICLEKQFNTYKGLSYFNFISTNNFPEMSALKFSSLVSIQDYLNNVVLQEFNSDFVLHQLSLSDFDNIRIVLYTNYPNFDYSLRSNLSASIRNYNNCEHTVDFNFGAMFRKALFVNKCISKYGLDIFSIYETVTELESRQFGKIPIIQNYFYISLGYNVIRFTEIANKAMSCGIDCQRYVTLLELRSEEDVNLLKLFYPDLKVFSLEEVSKLETDFCYAYVYNE